MESDVDPCLAESDAEEKTPLESISAWKFAVTFLANIMAIVVDPCLAEFEAEEKNLRESISAWKFAITVSARHHGCCRGLLLSRIRCRRKESA